MAEYPDSKPYNLTQINIPMGFGIKYDLTERVTIGTELLYRHTFTDHIDDVSTKYIDRSSMHWIWGNSLPVRNTKGSLKNG